MLFLVPAAPPAWPQSGAVRTGASGRASVLMEVTVANGRGEAIGGLACDDFRLYDNGRPANLESCEPSAGHDIALVVDKRSLLLVPDRAVWKDLKRGLLSLGRSDRVALLSVAYGDSRWLHDFTASAQAIVETLDADRTRSRMQSTKQPVFDGIAEAAQKFQPSGARISRAVFVLSNDQARGSRITHDAAMEEALKANVGVYHVILSSASGSVGVVTLPWPLPRPEIRGVYGWDI